MTHRGYTEELVDELVARLEADGWTPSSLGGLTWFGDAAYDFRYATIAVEEDGVRLRIGLIEG
ncbi:hypothetical protein [Demequina subtropica]|uniref:hypothetical protein n=1 Tax=Demequina subtropica TaxID=1638989 RepID=UPI0007837DCF|nr:hypothetical protein [Demequina subtropica]